MQSCSPESKTFMNNPPQDKSHGLIFDIQRYAIHDGPGIRTLVFLKGCPLICPWCDNPESQSITNEIMYTAANCTRCGHCAEVCPNKAIFISDDIVITDRALCRGCGKCAEVCPNGARQLAARVMSVDDVLDEVKRDALFYKNSGGGVTLTGGEVLLQSEFAKQLLKECHLLGFHTAIETSGYGSWAKLRRLMAHVDLVLFDIKHPNPEIHLAVTGVSNQSILQNLKQINRMGKEIAIRIPVIPGFNDSPQTMRDIAKLLTGLENVLSVELLPYHRYGVSKYEKLGRQYHWAKETPSESQMTAFREIFVECGFDTTVH